MRSTASKVLAAVSALLVGAAAHATPRDAVTTTNLNTDTGGTCGGSVSSFVIPITGNYIVQSIVVSGQFTRVATGSCESEATLRIFDATSKQIIAIAPFGTCTGTGTVSNMVVKLPTPIAVTNATNWSVVTSETYNDSNSAADGRWDTLTVTLDDGPPLWLFVSDCGPVRAPGFTLANQSISANTVHWYKITLPVPAQNLGIFGQWYLDIDTEGSPLADMELALYDADGRLVAFDDDSGSGNQARLTFGAGAARPAVGNGSPFDNSNGTLDAGTYYIALAPFDATFGPVGWKVSTDVNASTMGRLNVRTNINFSPFCKGDFNQDGNYNAQDILDFLNTWFSGCP